MSTTVDAAGSFEHIALEDPHRPSKNSASLTPGYDDTLFSIPDLAIPTESPVSPSLLQLSQYENTHSHSFSPLAHLNTQGRISPSCERSIASLSGAGFEPDSATPGLHSHSAELNTPTRGGASSKPRKRPQVELAPDQPLTTQGKPRTRVFSACLQWWVKSTRNLWGQHTDVSKSESKNSM